MLKTAARVLRDLLCFAHANFIQNSYKTCKFTIFGLFLLKFSGTSSIKLPTAMNLRSWWAFNIKLVGRAEMRLCCSRITLRFVFFWNMLPLIESSWLEFKSTVSSLGLLSKKLSGIVSIWLWPAMNSTKILLFFKRFFGSKLIWLL